MHEQAETYCEFKSIVKVKKENTARTFVLNIGIITPLSGLKFLFLIYHINFTTERFSNKKPGKF